VGPTPGGPPPGEAQITFTADRMAVQAGECANLQWTVQGGFAVQMNLQPVQATGQMQVCPQETTSYILAVDLGERMERREIVIEVAGGPGPQPTQPGTGPAPTTAPGSGCAGAPTFTYFTASPSSISAGQQVQLSWGAVTNGTSGPLVGSVVLSPGGFGEVGSPGSRWASPTTTTTYRLTATGCGGTATKDVTVTVGGAAPAATATPHPGGPTATATPHPAGPTATKQAPTATPYGILVTAIPWVPAPTATATTGSTMAALQLTNKCGRFIDSVYIRESGESSWGSDRLSQNDYLGHGEARTFQLAPGDYNMRAECCGQKVVSEHSVSLSSGTYDWTVVAALDIHNDTGEQIEELYIVPSTQAGWGNNLFEQEPSWPGCATYGWSPYALVSGHVVRCFFSPGSYDLRAVTRYGQVYSTQQANLQGNSAWFVKTQFWTPPAD